MGVKRNPPVTTTFLARLCGVSQGTVDRALHNRSGISPQTRDKILAAAKEYGYRPNIHAQSLSSGKNSIIGIVVFDLHNDYFCDLIMNLETAFYEAGMFPLIMFSEKDRSREKDCIETLYSIGADGCILCPVNGGDSFGHYLSSLEIPMITIGNRVPGIPYVGVDNYQAMYDLTVRRISQGFQNLHYFAPVLERNGGNIDAQQQRYQGFQDAAKAHRVPYTLFTSQPESPTALCPDAKTAVLASTDYYALRLVYSGVPVSQVSGFDRIRALNSYRISLTTVDSHSQETSREILNLFLSQQNPTDILIPHTLIVP